MRYANHLLDLPSGLRLLVRRLFVIAPPLFSAFFVTSALAASQLSDDQLQDAFIPPPGVVEAKADSQPSTDECEKPNQRSLKNADNQRAELKYLVCQEDAKNQDKETEEDEDEGLIFSVADYIALYGVGAGSDLNLSGMLALGEGFYSDGWLSALIDRQNAQLANELFGANNIFTWLESLLAGGLSYAKFNSLLGGSDENFGPEFSFIGYIYEPITDEHHLEITEVSTGWRVIDVKAAP